MAVSAAITGGDFHLATRLDGTLTVITGDFTRGTVRQPSGFTGCASQRYDVTGVLGHLDPGSAGRGTGTFAATLTHYRTEIFGQCVTLSVSVSGSLSLASPLPCDSASAATPTALSRPPRTGGPRSSPPCPTTPGSAAAASGPATGPRHARPSSTRSASAARRPAQKRTSRPAATSASARSSPAARPPARPVSGPPARPLSWQQQPPPIHLSSQAHDRQAAALTS